MQQIINLLNLFFKFSAIQDFISSL